MTAGTMLNNVVLVEGPEGSGLTGAHEGSHSFSVNLIKGGAVGINGSDEMKVTLSLWGTWSGNLEYEGEYISEKTARGF